jgi:hypothetical protein
MNHGTQRLLPLPKGEGWGEGEGIVRLPTVHNKARAVLQPTVYGDLKLALGTTILWTCLTCLT